MSKTLSNTNAAEAKQNSPSLTIVGNGDAFKLLFKAFDTIQGWMKSTKAYEIPNHGCIVQTTTQQKNIDGTYSLCDALTYVHGTRIIPDVYGGNKLEAISLLDTLKHRDIQMMEAMEFLKNATPTDEDTQAAKDEVAKLVDKINSSGISL